MPGGRVHATKGSGVGVNDEGLEKSVEGGAEVEHALAVAAVFGAGAGVSPLCHGAAGSEHGEALVGRPVDLVRG